MLLFDYTLTISNDLFQREIKFSNQQVYWYYYIVWWEKTGPAHPFPPPYKMFRSLFLSFSLLDYTTLSQYLNTYELSIPMGGSSFQANKFIGNRRVGKTGPAHNSSPPPQKKKKSFDLSIDRLVFWFMLLFHCILTFMNDIFQRKNHLLKPNSLFVLPDCGVGKDWAGPFFPPSKCFDLSIYLAVFRIMLLFHPI